MQGWFDVNYYELSREQNYRYHLPTVIVEEFFSVDGDTVPKDYKMFCVDGVPKCIRSRFRSLWSTYTEFVRFELVPDSPISTLPKWSGRRH